MKKIYGLLLCTFCISAVTSAQFISNGQIEFEVKTNIKKTFGSSPWAESMKDKLPTFKVSYFKYKFSESKSIYQFDRWENKDLIPDMFRNSDEKAIWYTDFNTQLSNMQKQVFGTAFTVKDSLMKIEWRLSNENRIIAGYNCKKAVGKIMDSVYVFAFYTEEIIIPGGPCSINGLPGMILGMTIPRLYTSWMTTKVSAEKNTPVISEPESNTNIFNRRNAASTIKAQTKDWVDESDPESRKWVDQLMWNMML